jgi:sec-independent protein translocase protein TatB
LDELLDGGVDGVLRVLRDVRVFFLRLRGMAKGAETRLRDEMGDDFDAVEWKSLDPRQYDPRRIIREALQEEPAMNPAQKLNSAKPTRTAKLVPGETAPFDSEAT